MSDTTIYEDSQQTTLYFKSFKLTNSIDFNCC